MKRKISNTGDTIFNHNFFNIRVVVYRAWITIIVVIFHRPCAADGQRAVGVQFPGQVVFVPVGYDFAFVYAEVITFSVEPLSRYTVKLLHLSNTPLPMMVTLFGIVMLVKLLQLSNTLYPMLVTLSGIVMLVKLVQL